MSAPPADFVPTPAAAAPDPVPLRASPARCLRCATDLSRLPASARFCPRCGLEAVVDEPTIMSAYAHALYNLARQYESGPEGKPNLREAVRYYLKAARLGNYPAFARLSSGAEREPDEPDTSLDATD